MSKSLRWTLLSWHAASLAGVVVAFVLTVWLAVGRSMLDEVDQQLRRQAGDLAASLVSLEDGRYALELSPAQARFFTRDSDRGLFYVLWGPGGALIDASHPELDVPRLAPPGRRTRGPWRELSVSGPAGATVQVGRNIHERQSDLQRLLGVMMAVAALSLFLGLASGWFVTGRALAPIARITRAASEISASNPSKRIDVERMEAELHELGATINRAFDRLQDALQRQTRFTEDASHELRTPLAIIVSQLEYALKRDRSPAEYRETLAVIQRTTDRMRNVVANLLRLTALEGAADERQWVPLALDEVVRDACQELAPWIRHHGIRCLVDLQPAWIRGARDALSDLVLNLVTNAVRYNRPHGTVRLTLTHHAGRAVLRVCDTGTGIPEADRPYVFERFYRVDSARSRAAGGSGLGLAIAKQVVDRHGGQIAVEETSDRGTTIRVDLPCCPPGQKRHGRGGPVPDRRAPDPGPDGTLAPR